MSPLPGATRGSHFSRRLLALPLACLTATVLCSNASHALTPDQTGKWTLPVDWDRIAVHLALLPGHGSDAHSRVLLWYGLGNHERLYGRLWRWNPEERADTTFPTAAFSERTFNMPPDSSQIFCSSNTHLGDGRLLVAGGTQAGTENGIRQVNIFDPVSETWTPQDSMQGYRWYPTSTLMPDGRVVVTSGSKYKVLELFGGRRGNESAPRDTGLFRYGLWRHGLVEPKVTAYRTQSSAYRPPRAREDHAGAYNAYTTATVMFGGRDSAQRFNDTWFFYRNPNWHGVEDDYTWNRMQVDGSPGAPSRRFDHSIAVDNATGIAVLFGGVKDTSTTSVVASDTWSFSITDSSGPIWSWVSVAVSNPSVGPGLRRGHTAVFDAARNRMVVFGGRADTSDSATDSCLYVLTFTNNSRTVGSWTRVTPTGPHPSPRYDHMLAYDYGFGEWRDSAFVFGGELGGGAKSNELWRLDLNTLTWARRDLHGMDLPSPRSNGSLLALGGHGELIVFGGTTATGGPDDTVYYAHFHPMEPGGEAGWHAGERLGTALTGQLGYIRAATTWERAPEVASVGDGTNSVSWGSPAYPARLQEWYPQGFALDSSRVFFAGPSADTTWLFYPDARVWRRFPASAPSFKGGSAVMYRPGKVMKCGMRDTDASGADAHGRTAWIDLTQGASATWTTTGDMLPRVNHNLVMLPTGEVFVTGGTQRNNNAVLMDPQYQPQLWIPPSASSAARWYGQDTLAVDTVPRDYHSTAVLLPDGRVLCAGGNADLVRRNWANIFSPPYLFNSDGSLRTRPVIEHAPNRVRYGRSFRIGVGSGTTVASACLIKAGATTHAFDEDQRFVPLTVDTVDGSTVEFEAVPDSATAPPGDYLLFVLRADRTPSIARWVRVGSMGLPLDAAAPSTADIQPELVSPNAVYVSWPSPGDDSDSGTAQAFDVRWRTSAITSQNFTSSDIATGVPSPASPGEMRGVWITGLSACTWYHFAIRTVDATGNLSSITTCSVKTLCNGGGGGGANAVAAGEDDVIVGAPANGRAGGASLVQANALTPGHSSDRFVAAYATRDGRAVLALTRAAGQAAAGDSACGLEVVDAGDGQSRAATTPPAALVGLRSLVRPGALATLDPSALEGVVTRGATQRLERARHSRLGDLTPPEGESGLLRPELVAGDTLVLEYAPAEPDSSAEDCFVMVRFAAPVVAPTARRPSLAPASTPKPVFALGQNQPNPFRAATTIRFSLPSTERVRLELFDLQGRRLGTLVRGTLAAGEHVKEWDRRLPEGGVAAPGLYMVRLEAGRDVAVKKLLVLP